MRVHALITGVQNIKGTSKGSGKPFDFYKVNFIDTENPGGSTQEMTLGKDDLIENIKSFEGLRMKTCTFNLFQNEQYNNFGGFLK